MDTRTFEINPKIEMKKVQFKNRYGIVLAGDLYLPEEYAEKIKACMAFFPTNLPERAYQDVLTIYNTKVMKKKYQKFYGALSETNI